MKQIMKDLKKDITKDKGWFFTYTILFALVLFNNLYLIINIAGLYSIENMLRLTVCIIIVILTILFVFLMMKALIKHKKGFYITLLVITLIITSLIGFINVNFNIIYSKINKVSSSYTTYSISLVTASDNNVDAIDKIGSEDIAIINDHDIANGYTFGEQILQDKKMSNTLKEYESYTEILDALLNGNIKYAFLPSNYADTFNSITGYEKIGTELKTIYEQSKQEEQLASTKDITEPFTILFMGVDSTNDSIANTTANGDSLMLITFNPKTLSATMVSIPRDSYVPITCMSNKKNKITHSSWGGESCIINTIEQFTGVDIDYYVKINFTGLVKLVDNLGGIDVNVEYSFCEQNSKREWGDNTVYVKEGLQTLSGEQALAYARNRHTNPTMCSKEYSNYNSNDFIRGQHQQDIIKAIMSKIKDIKDLDTFYNLLNTIGDNMETNMESNTIISFYNVAKDIVTKSKNATSIDQLVNIQKLYISGYDANIYDYSQKTNSGMKMVLYDFVPYQGSIDDVVEAMNINLGLSSPKVVKTFSYDINSPYEEEVVGKGSYSGSSVTLLPDFTGKTKSYVENYASAHNLKVSFISKEGTSYKAGTVISQDPPAKMDIDAMSSSKGLTITLASGTSTTTSTNKYSICKDKDNADSDTCKLNIADYIDTKYTSIEALKIDTDIIKFKYESTTTDEKDQDGKIISVDGKTSGTVSLYDGGTIIVKYYKYTESSTEPASPSA